MRLRPNLWCRARKRVPRSTYVVSAGPAGNAIPKNGEGRRASPCTPRQSASPMPSALRARQRGASEDVVLGDLHALEAERAHALHEHRHARDDRRRTVGVQAGHLAALLQRHRREEGELLLERRQLEDVPVHPRRVVGVELQLDRGGRRRVPATAIAAWTLRATSSGSCAASVARKSSTSEATSSGSGGSSCRWRSPSRTTPACMDTWKSTSGPWPVTSSVEPPPMSMTTSSSRAGALRRRARGTSARPPRRR